jgi:CTP synthase
MAPVPLPSGIGTVTRSPTPIDRLAAAGLAVSGTSPDGCLVEFVELDRSMHPFAVGTQAHPELKSRPTRPHPLFVAFVGAAVDYLRGERLPIETDDPAQHPADPSATREVAAVAGVGGRQRV